jgi:hypothetical protein
MIEFLLGTLQLFPFLFATYFVLEAVEAQAGGALERFLERARSVGPLVGALAGAVPHCGVSAAASSLFAAGVVSAGTLLAVFLSTSDELVPVLVSARAPVALVVKVVGLKICFAIAAGFSLNGILAFFRRRRRDVDVGELCGRSHCHCHARKGLFLPALIHSLEIFFFIAVVSGAVHLAMVCFGEGALERLCLNRPFVGELVAGAVGLVPNCAVSVVGAKLYLAGAMSPGALMAGSFTGSGVGLLVLFRTNRRLGENVTILAVLYALGVVFGRLAGFLI